MRTILLANNRLGFDVARYLAEQNDLEALVLHPIETRKFATAFNELGAPTVVWPEGLDEIRAVKPECLLSVLFAYKLPPTWLSVPTWRALNLHPALLPYNRGRNPNVWPLVDGTPAGTTLHVMDEEIDTGDIVCQWEVVTYPDDTAYSLYRRLEAISLAMFEWAWPQVKSLETTPQPAGGTYHKVSELTSLDPTTPEELQLIDRLRARTFPPYGAEIDVGGRRYRVRVEIDPVE